MSSISPAPASADAAPASMKVLTTALPGAEVRPLDNSYHVAKLDNDAPEIFDGSLAFIQKHSIAKQNG